MIVPSRIDLTPHTSQLPSIALSVSLDLPTPVRGPHAHGHGGTPTRHARRGRGSYNTFTYSLQTAIEFENHVHERDTSYLGGEIVACSMCYRGRQRLTGEILRGSEPCPEW